MNSLVFIKMRGLKNSIKRGLKKPKTYFFGVFLVAYLFFVLCTVNDMISNMKGDSTRNFVSIISGMTIFIIAMNIYTYSKKKGLIFTRADINFCCCSPNSPKQLLIYAGFRNFVGNLFIIAMIIAMGIGGCNIPVHKIIVLAVLYLVLETVLEIAVIIILYGSEKIGSRVSMLIRIGLLTCIGILFFICVWECISIRNIGGIGRAFNGDKILFVPILGWNVALIRLVIIGPTLWNLVNSVIYVATVAIITIVAIKISCNGEYYEEAMAFSEDYAEALKRSKEGKGIQVVGYKEKYKTANVKYKGKYGKAIYYRQLLEAKKNRFGRYGLTIYGFLILGIVSAFVIYITGLEWSPYIVPGISLYMTFLFSEMKSKLETEIKNPYTYLIPDNVFAKIFYATKFDIERCVVEGTLLTLPIALMSGFNPVAIISVIVLHCTIRCLKFYATVVTNVLMGTTIVPLVKSCVSLIIFLILGLIGVALVLMIEVFAPTTVALVICVVYGISINALLMLIASRILVVMETQQ